MIFMPSRGRRKSLERFFADSMPCERGVVLIDDDDIDTYLDMDLPLGWTKLAAERKGAAGALRNAYELYPDEPWYGVVADDVVARPDGWDQRLAEACQPEFVAWGDDGRWGDKLCTTFFVGAGLVKKLGWLVPPGFGHLYVDRGWGDIAWGAGVARYLPAIHTAHMNVHDETYMQRAIQGDAARYERVVSSGELNEWVKRARLG